MATRSSSGAREACSGAVGSREELTLLIAAWLKLETNDLKRSTLTVRDSAGGLFNRGYGL